MGNLKYKSEVIFLLCLSDMALGTLRIPIRKVWEKRIDSIFNDKNKNLGASKITRPFEAWTNEE